MKPLNDSEVNEIINLAYDSCQKYILNYVNKKDFENIQITINLNTTNDSFNIDIDIDLDSDYARWNRCPEPECPVAFFREGRYICRIPLVCPPPYRFLCWCF